MLEPGAWKHGIERANPYNAGLLQNIRRVPCL